MSLYLMCGMAFSGKSTLAGALARHLGAEVVSLDAINDARGLAGGLGIPEAEWARTHHEALGQLEGLLGTGSSVIIDDTNCFRFLRDAYRAVADRHGLPTTVIYLDRPLELLLARIEENEATQARPAIAAAVLTDLALKFEPPGPDEQVLNVPPDASVDEWVARTFPAPAGFSYVWEFEVPPAHSAEFERHYGPAGTWARLFHQAAGYLGTLLLRDLTTPGRYLTVDRWRSEAAYRAFRQRFAQEYEDLDRRCEHLTTSERQLGSFTEPRGPAAPPAEDSGAPLPEAGVGGPGARLG
ncbi:MAG TPA: AAA family ATPase [Thermoanaerobaculia bacterium]|nr:AAA family ATPase [Thermoanaerobaculia bacterium]